MWYAEQRDLQQSRGASAPSTPARTPDTETKANCARITRASLSGEERETVRELDAAEQWLATQPNIVDAIVAALEHEYDANDDSAATMVARKHGRVSKVLEAWRAAGSPTQS